eukprot:138081_1
MQNRNKSKQLLYDYILTLLIYCNCDNFQNKWSESFRFIIKHETNISLKQRHSYFYHLSVNLRNLIEYFGDKLIKNKSATFYHGVAQILYFTQTITQFNG